MLIFFNCLEVSETMYTYVVGDIHGCFNTLKNLVKKLPSDSDLIFVGDLCDRGKYSKEVIDFVMKNNYRCIRGNHEKYLIDHLEDVLFNDKRELNWLKPKWGGQATVDSYKNTSSSIIKKHLVWLKSLPSFILIEDKYFITHGYGLPYFMRRKSHDEKIKLALMSNRIDDEKYKFDWEDYSKYEVINIFGHCKFDEVLIGKNYYGIDTGCLDGGKLTAIELGSMRIIDEPLNYLDIF